MCSSFSLAELWQPLIGWAVARQGKSLPPAGVVEDRLLPTGKASCVPSYWGLKLARTGRT